jgi:hypothetical protein
MDSELCTKVVCSKCGKYTWSGCGKHKDRVLKDVPLDKRCQCKR